MLVPNFLGTIKDYRALETGHALAWVAAPMFAVVWLVAFTIVYTNSQLILAVGLTIAVMACRLCAQVDSSWAGNSFRWLELTLSCGFACTYVGLVSSIVLEGLDAGALGSAANMATFSGFMHFVRIFRRPDRSSCDDTCHYGARAVSFQPTRTACAGRQLAYRRTGLDSDRGPGGSPAGSRKHRRERSAS